MFAFVFVGTKEQEGLLSSVVIYMKKCCFCYLSSKDHHLCGVESFRDKPVEGGMPTNAYLL